jgi:hypothetical protein
VIVRHKAVDDARLYTRHGYLYVFIIQFMGTWISSEFIIQFNGDFIVVAYVIVEREPHEKPINTATRNAYVLRTPKQRITDTVMAPSTGDENVWLDAWRRQSYLRIFVVGIDVISIVDVVYTVQTARLNDELGVSVRIHHINPDH